MFKVQQSVERDHVVKLVRETDKQFDNLTWAQHSSVARPAPSVYFSCSHLRPAPLRTSGPRSQQLQVNSPWFTIHLNTHEKEGITWAAILQAACESVGTHHQSTEDSRTLLRGYTSSLSTLSKLHQLITSPQMPPAPATLRTRRRLQIAPLGFTLNF